MYFVLDCSDSKPLHIKVDQKVPVVQKHDGDAGPDISVKEHISRWAMLDPEASESLFRKMIGEGDYDDAVRSRIATGLIAISAITGDMIPDNSLPNENPVASVPRVALARAKAEYIEQEHNWGIQVGAYTSRDSANKAIAQAVQKLPASLRQVTASIAPRKVDGNWVFRGRLKGYSKENAHQACDLLEECLIVPPQVYKN